jgi:serine/threonine protein kinase/tetratricopeptide (TPR) repeat protein
MTASPPASFRASVRAALSSTAAIPAADPLADHLAAEMGQRWRRGERPVVEDYLELHPELREKPEAAFHLICEELCLREEHGATVDTAAVVQRFPQWAAQLQVVLACRELFQPAVAPTFPQVGESFGEYRILAELGRGAVGRVYLAAQPALADRTVVVKLTPCDGHEHLSLARLQHTHIVPLYAVQDDPQRNLRSLCMPYFGGATLAWLTESLPNQPVATRSGRDLLTALDKAEATRPVAAPTRGVARTLYARASYTQSICWIGTCLADALHYAHERGLVHLDLKPSNILVAADGQPMLLDFHLARKPLRPEDPDPDWLGGTFVYMSPEQRTAVDAVRNGQRIPAVIDGRSDVYSLGLLLYEALGGPMPSGSMTELRRRNPAVSAGLVDILAKCLAPDPKDRYADAAALAADLRNHLSDRPLVGAGNRSLKERWLKWHRRHPHGFRRWGWAATLLLGCAVAAGMAWHQVEQRRQEADHSLLEGRQYLDRGELILASKALTRGRDLARQFPASTEQLAALDTELRRARRLELSGELQRVADQARFAAGGERLSPPQAQKIVESCRSIWEARQEIWEARADPGNRRAADLIRADLLDIAVLLADLTVQAAPPAERPARQREALEVLGQAEALLGSSFVLFREREALARSLGLADAGRPASQLAPATAWEHAALGRSLLRAGRLPEAAAAFERALRQEPQNFWSHFYQGTCAYRMKQFADAAGAFRTCIALAPEKPECYFNRALAYQALGDLGHAMEDYDVVLRLNPSMAAAALNRGFIRLQQKKFGEAIGDLELALKLGADPATVYFDLALVYQEQNDRTRALASAERALQHQPDHKDARALRDRLRIHR